MASISQLLVEEGPCSGQGAMAPWARLLSKRSHGLMMLGARYQSFSPRNVIFERQWHAHEGTEQRFVVFLYTTFALYFVLFSVYNANSRHYNYLKYDEISHGYTHTTKRSDCQDLTPWRRAQCQCYVQHIQIAHHPPLMSFSCKISMHNKSLWIVETLGILIPRPISHVITLHHLSYSTCWTKGL